jgi:hypothetical protein
MKNSNYTYWFVAVFAIFLLIATHFFASVFLVNNRLDSQKVGIGFLEVRENIQFELIPNNNNFNIIVFAFKNPGLANKSDYTFSLSKGDDLLRQINFSGDNVGDPADVKLQFDPIPNSLGNSYTIKIIPKDFERPILINCDSGGTPSYRTYYRTLNKNIVLSEAVREWKTNFAEGKLFFIVWVGLLAAVLYYGSRKNEK